MAFNPDIILFETNTDVELFYEIELENIASGTVELILTDVIPSAVWNPVKSQEIFDKYKNHPSFHYPTIGWKYLWRLTSHAIRDIHYRKWVHKDEKIMVATILKEYLKTHREYSPLSHFAELHKWIEVTEKNLFKCKDAEGGYKNNNLHPIYIREKWPISRLELIGLRILIAEYIRHRHDFEFKFDLIDTLKFPIKIFDEVCQDIIIPHTREKMGFYENKIYTFAYGDNAIGGILESIEYEYNDVFKSICFNEEKNEEIVGYFICNNRDMTVPHRYRGWLAYHLRNYIKLSDERSDYEKSIPIGLIDNAEDIISDATYDKILQFMDYNYHIYTNKNILPFTTLLGNFNTQVPEKITSTSDYISMRVNDTTPLPKTVGNHDLLDWFEKSWSKGDFPSIDLQIKNVYIQVHPSLD